MHEQTQEQVEQPKGEYPTKPCPRISVVILDAPGLATVAFDVKAHPIEKKWDAIALSPPPAPVSDALEPLYQTTVEDLVDQIVKGLEAAQRHGPLKSRAQALAITRLEEAAHWLRARPSQEDGR